MLALALGMTIAAAPLNVAVLYFDNNSGKREYDVLQKGLADMLVTDLAAVPSLQVVERDRLEAVLSEQKLQRGRYFDKATAVKLGKLVGASYAITGSLAAVSPQLRLDVRMFNVSTGAVTATGAVTGPQDDIFGLEQKLVAAFLGALDSKIPLPELRSGKTNLAGLVKYGQGLDLADQGDLAAAQSKLGEVVREAPDFTLAKTKYAELIKRLREAQKSRGSALQGVEATLQQHIDAWRAKRLADQTTADDVMHYFGYLHAQCHLQLFHMRRLLGVESHDQIVWAPPSKRAELAKYQRAWVEGAERLISDNRDFRKRGRARNKRAELTDEDKALGEQLTGQDLGPWSFSSAASIGIDAAELLLVGRTPWDSNIDRFSVRPSPVQLDATLRAKADAFGAAALKELPLDGDDDEVTKKLGELQDARAEGFVLDGKTADAVAQWQLFLDRYPKAELFPVLSKKIENALLISDEVEAAQKAVDACDLNSAASLSVLARRIARSEQVPGLTKLAERFLACGRKQKANHAFWEDGAWMIPARATLEIQDCPMFVAVRAKAAQSGHALQADALPRQLCDEP